MQNPTRRSAAQRLCAAVAISLAGYSGLACERAALAQQKAPADETPPAAPRDQPSPPAEPPAAIDGFPNEEQVRQAIRKDFPTAAAKITSAVHPSEKTTVLSIGVADLLPDTGNARISYIFGYRSKKLI
jgi:hypothetical protein